jgi:predicted outer membrane repeat protein
MRVRCSTTAIRRTVAVMFRFSRLLAVLLLAVTACEPAVTPLAVPDGLPLSSLSPAQRALLRATLAIDEVRDEATVVLDAEALTISGDLELDNVGAGGAKTATLRIYGRASAESEEVLLGLATSSVTITPKEAVYLDFKGATFETCSAGVDGACGLLFDRNRNGASNVVDLVAAIDPAPAAPFLQASPSTLQFSSGIRLGSFARQVVVVENLADHRVRIDAVQVAGGQGVGVSLFDPNTGGNSTPRRRLSTLDLDVDADGASDIVLSPGEEVFVAVSFAPVNAFLTTASIQIAATDIVTGVAQGVRAKVIANSDGALRPRDADYVEPTTTSVNLGGGSLPTEAFPSGELFSGSDVTSTSSSTGLTHTGVSLVATKADGSTLAMPADAAFAVDIAAGQRFAAALDADDDIDLALLELAADGTFTVLSTSQQQGDSSEAVELLNDGADSRSVVLVLGRVGVFAPVAVAGALVAADQPLPFRLSCQLTRGPELDDVEPISPTRGSLDGGETITIRGRGFYTPATSAGPHVRVTVGGEPVVAPPRIVTADDGTQTVTFVLPSGNNSISDVLSTVVVENPSTSGGDGQAATLPEGFRYDLPTARISRVAPDVASTSGSTADVTVRGAFFFDVHGLPPIVKFDDEVATDVELVDSTTLLVAVPPHAAGNTQLTVTNVVFGGLEGAPSNPVDFTFVAPQGAAPTLTSVAPTSGTALGGDVVTLTGSGFVSGSRVFFGGNEAVVTGSTDTTLTVLTTPVAAAGDVEVAVVNPDGQTAVLDAAFEFVLPPPSISGAFPDRAAVGGNTIVVVTGAGFRDDTTVSFTTASGSVDARSVTRTSSTTLLVTTPPTTAGDAELVARNGDGQEASTSFAFFAPQGPPPSGLSISPSTGNVGGGTSVSLTATGVRTPVVVVFGDTVIDDAVVVPLANGRTRLDVITPPGEAGNTAVSVVNVDGQTATATFTYVDTQEPRLVGLRPSFVHARIPGDEILGFGENLSQLGSTSSLTATAVVQGAANEGQQPLLRRVPLSVQFGSDGFVSLVVDTPLPAGSLAVELSGAGITVVSEQRIASLAPEITSASFDDSTETLTLVGNALAGERISSMTAAGAPCTILNASERFISCRFVGVSPTDPAPPFIAAIDYGAGDPVELEFTPTQNCDRQNCNDRGECRFEGNNQICECEPPFSGANCELCTAPGCVDQGAAVVVNDPANTVFPNGLCSLSEAVAALDTGAVGDCVVPGGAKLVRLGVDVQMTAAQGPVVLSDVDVDGDGHTINVVGTAFVLQSGVLALKNITFTSTFVTNTVIVDTEATLTNVKFREQSGPVSTLVVNAVGRATLNNCSFENILNTGTNGGAVTVHGSLTVLNSRFVNDATETGSGGAIFVSPTGSISAADTVFHGNESAGRGGAIHVASVSTTVPAVFDRCAFTNNTSLLGAGALHVDEAGVHLRQSTVAGNSSDASTSAGGIQDERGALDISSSTIVGNRGVFVGGVRTGSGLARIRNSIITRNAVTDPSNTHDLEATEPASLVATGQSLVGATNVAPTAFVSADAAFLPVTAFNGESVASSVLKPALAVADPAVARGDCIDVDGVALSPDQVGTPRPAAQCTLGAVQVVPDATGTIVVNGTSDAPNGCTLRSAIEAASRNTPIGNCQAGGKAPRIEFAAGLTSVNLSAPIDVVGATPVVIDGLANHEGDVVTISNELGRVFNISGAPMTLLGVALQGGGTENDGGVVAVFEASLRLVESTIQGGNASRGGGVFVQNGVVTLFRSAIASGSGSPTDGEAAFVSGDGSLFVERSSVQGTSSGSLVASNNVGGLVVLRRASLNSIASESSTLLAGLAHVTAEKSILHASGRALCGPGGIFTNFGNNVFSDSGCPNNPETDRVVSGQVFLDFGRHGGRTPSWSVSPSSEIAAFTSCTDVDQRGRPAPSTICTPGAFFTGPPECGDGFVDPGSERVVEVLNTSTLPFSNGVIGTGNGAFGPSIVVADPAGGRYVSCSGGTCGPEVDISSTTTSPIVAVGVAAVFNPPFPPSSEVVILTVDGAIHGFDELVGAPTSSGALQEITSPVDAVFFDNPATGFEIVAVGAAGAIGTLERLRLDGTFTQLDAIPLGAAAAKGLVFKPINGVGNLLVRRGVNSSLTASSATIDFFNGNALSYSTAVLPGTQNGVVSKPTHIVGRNDALWTAQEVASNFQLSRGAGNVTLNGATFPSRSLLGGDVEGDAAEELVAVTEDGQVRLFAEAAPDIWQPRLVIGGALSNADCRFAEVQPALKGLVCMSGSTFQVVTLAPGGERCDPDDLFSEVQCNESCTGPEP